MYLAIKMSVIEDGSTDRKKNREIKMHIMRLRKYNKQKYKVYFTNLP